MTAEANAASLALVRNGEVLLIRRARPPFKGLWTLPGGRREPGESIEATAIREMAEEMGLAVTALQPVLVMPAGAAFRLQVFATASFSGEPIPSDEVAAWRWADRAAAAALPTTPGLADVLDRAFGMLTAVSAPR